MSIAPGKKVGSYEVLSAIGAGGMGEVYKARDTKLGREVALKSVPMACIGDAERMARFDREAKLLASLNHPNIASIYGLEDSGGTPALVMELVEGPTLADRIAAGPIAMDEALPMARQICEALEFAHERGIVHRDLKPANIKVTHEGVVKVLDFGLAKALDCEGSPGQILSSPTITQMATRAGVILGTAAYMGPEQAKGKPADRRADVWAFGCVVYEMLTGKMAFRADSVSETLAEVMRGEPDWSLLPANTSSRIRHLLQRCLRKDPRQRLQAIGEARIAIEETLAANGAEGEAAPVERSGGGRSVMPWTVAAVACAALVAAIIWSVAFHQARREPMHFRAVTNFAGIQAQPALSPDGRSVALVSNRDRYYNIYVALVGGGNLVQITQGPNFKSGPRWSPDGSTIAYSQLNESGTFDIWQVAALGGNPRRLILNATDPDWSPDGRSMAYANLADGTIWIADSTGQNARRATSESLHSTHGALRDVTPRFSPDGKQLAYVARADGPYGQLMVADLISGKFRVMTNDVALVLSPAWAPDSRSIYFSSSRGGTMNIWKIPVAGGTPEQVTTGQGDDAQLDVSGDGKRIVFATFRESMGIARIDLEANGAAGEAKFLTTDPARNQIAPTYSPDGKYLAYFSNLKGVEKEGIWISNADGTDAVRLVSDERVNIFPRWGTDGRHLLYMSYQRAPSSELAANGLTAFRTNDEYRRVSIAGGAPETILKGAPDLYADVGGDGRLLFRDADGNVQTYDPASGKQQALGHLAAPERCYMLRWSHDQHSVAYIARPGSEDDSQAGLWVTDFKGAPRKVFKGWVLSYARGPNDTIYILEGKSDLSAVLWRISWDGGNPTRLPVTTPFEYSFWDTGLGGSRMFDLSPDARYMVVQQHSVSEANIGMIDAGP